MLRIATYVMPQPVMHYAKEAADCKYLNEDSYKML